jgi:hypothetical protein
MALRETFGSALGTSYPQVGTSKRATEAGERGEPAGRSLIPYLGNSLPLQYDTCCGRRGTCPKQLDWSACFEVESQNRAPVLGLPDFWIFRIILFIRRIQLKRCHIYNLENNYREILFVFCNFYGQNYAHIYIHRPPDPSKLGVAKLVVRSDKPVPDFESRSSFGSDDCEGEHVAIVTVHCTRPVTVPTLSRAAALPHSLLIEDSMLKVAARGRHVR